MSSVLNRRTGIHCGRVGRMSMASAAESSLWYAFFASNRTTVRLDPATPAGNAELLRLVERADVVLACDGAFGVHEAALADALAARPRTGRDRHVVLRTRRALARLPWHRIWWLAHFGRRSCDHGRRGYAAAQDVRRTELRPFPEPIPPSPALAAVNRVRDTGWRPTRPRPRPRVHSLLPRTRPHVVLVSRAAAQRLRARTGKARQPALVQRLRGHARARAARSW